jgi:tetratricopeptide (TPR) repeat protein
MNRHELQERYEIRGDETDYLAAKPLYEQALAGGGDPQLLLEYGYLLECHARNELRQAVARYRRATELDPDFDKAWYQLIHALAALGDSGEAKASTGDPDGALADWHHALDLDNSDIGPLFSAAYLFDREGRIDEAIQAWQLILTWHEQHGDQLGAEFPQRELARVSQHRPHA